MIKNGHFTTMAYPQNWFPPPSFKHGRLLGRVRISPFVDRFLSTRQICSRSTPLHDGRYGSQKESAEPQHKHTYLQFYNLNTAGKHNWVTIDIADRRGLTPACCQSERRLEAQLLDGQVDNKFIAWDALSSSEVCRAEFEASHPSDVPRKGVQTDLLDYLGKRL